MRGLLMLGVLVAGCSGDTITIEVSRPPDTDVKMVELFIGRGPICTTVDQNGDAMDCPGIGPPDGVATRPETEGDVYFIDNVRPFTSKVGGDGIARFSIDPSGELLPVLIAVGTDVNGIENSVAIMKELPLDQGSLRVVVQLETAGGALTRDPVPSAELTHVDVWPDASPFRAPDVDTCVGAEFKGRRVFVVPEGDHDCDFVAAENECKEFVHLAKEPQTSVEAKDVLCSFPSALMDATPICRLGLDNCDEEAGDGIRCGNLREVCISDVICGSCRDLSEVCLRGALVNEGPKISAIKCTIELLTSINDGHLESCNTTGTAEPAVLPGTCLKSTLSKLQFPFEFADQLAISTGSNANELIALTTRPATNGSCTFDLAFTARFPAGVTPESIRLWSKFLVGDRDVLLPVLLDFLPVAPGQQCSGVTNCVFEPAAAPDEDGAGACLTADL